MKITPPETQFKVGQKFNYYGEKVDRVWTVEDVLYLINSAGDVLEMSYRCSSETLGQKVTKDFPQASISRSTLL